MVGVLHCYPKRDQQFISEVPQLKLAESILAYHAHYFVIYRSLWRFTIILLFTVHSGVLPLFKLSFIMLFPAPY